MPSKVHIINKLHWTLLVHFFVISIGSGGNFQMVISENPHLIRPKIFGIFLLSFRRGKLKKLEKFCISFILDLLDFYRKWLLNAPSRDFSCSVFNKFYIYGIIFKKNCFGIYHDAYIFYCGFKYLILILKWWGKFLWTDGVSFLLPGTSNKFFLFKSFFLSFPVWWVNHNNDWKQD